MFDVSDSSPLPPENLKTIRIYILYNCLKNLQSVRLHENIIIRRNCRFAKVKNLLKNEGLPFVKKKIRKSVECVAR